MLRALLSSVERLCEARLTKRSTSEFGLGATVVRQSDWETKIFSLMVSGENYGWAVDSQSRNREKA